MVYTGSYSNCKLDVMKRYSISGDRGKSNNPKWEGLCYPLLAPKKKEFWDKWHDNIGKISEEENMIFYITEYWKHVLSKLDVSEVYRELDESILLCYEDIDKFCHREIVAAWFELFLGVKVDEVKDYEDNKCMQIVERPKRYQFIKDTLEKAIKSTTDMKGFNSIRAFYLYEQSEKLKAKAEELKKAKDEYYELDMINARELRCQADREEFVYKIRMKYKNKQ